MESVPSHLDVDEIATSLAKPDAVHSVHDLHVWHLSSNSIMLTAHIIVNEMDAWPKTLSELKQLLEKQYEISHITLQPEPHQPTLYQLPNE